MGLSIITARGIRLGVLAVLFCLVPAAGQQSPAPEPQASGQPGEGSTLEVKPGQPTIKSTEIGRKPISPWKRLPRRVLEDQKAIWTSPFHTSPADAKWWAIFGGATVGLLATDKWTSKQLPNTEDQVAVARWTSRAGAVYTLLPISSGFYFLGMAADNDRFRETGILASETLINTWLVGNAIKVVTQRERPLEGDGTGRFFRGTGRIWNAGASFPSGHAITSFGLASVVAHQYHNKLWVPILAYGLATTVSASRFAARKHFASDVVVGGAMGWFIGDYVFAKRHNRELDPERSKLRRILAHVRLGVQMGP